MGGRRGLTFLTGDGKFARVQQLHIPAVRAVYALENGGFLALLYAPDALYEDSAGLIRMPSPVLRLSSTGEILDTIAAPPGPEQFVWTRASGPAVARPLFGKQLHVAVHADRVYIGTADIVGFHVLSWRGQLERVVRITNYDLAVTREAVSQERNLRFASNPSQTAREITSVLPDPSTIPAYSALHVDALGNVWLEQFKSLTHLDDPSRWFVVDPAGQVLGVISTPARFSVLEIGTDYVLGVLRDSVDVEHPVMFRLQR